MAALSGPILAACRDQATVATYHRGATIVEPGEAPRVAQFIEDGLCKLVWRSSDGRQALMGLRMRGWSIGVTTATWGESQPFATEALTRCAVLQIPIDAFKACVERSPYLLHILSRMHALELVQAHDIHLLALASLPARTRVEMLLSWLHGAGIAVQHECRDTLITSTLSQREMADVLAMTPETLTRMVRVLERDGLVVKRNGWITLLTPASGGPLGRTSPLPKGATIGAGDIREIGEAH